MKAGMQADELFIDGNIRGWREKSLSIAQYQ
jgi:hypothetical protein